jgi:hypothetical protein
MPAFKILDDLNTSLLDINSGKQSGLGKYLPDPVVKLLALRPIAKSLQKPLSESPTNPVTLEFATPDPVTLGADLSLEAGVSAAVGLHHPDELLFPADDLRDAISVPSGTAYVSLSLAPRVNARFDVERGPLAFGFAAGTAIGVRYFHPFDVAATNPTLAHALTETIQRAVLPGDVDDLAALPVGSHASVDGHGEVELSGSMALASVVNPLATPGLPVIGSAKVSVGASVNVAADWRASGAFELRVTKLADHRIRLAYYKRAGSEVSIETTAALGVKATVRDRDLLKMLMDAISGDPKADLEQLVNAGMNDAQIEALQDAVAKSIDRTVRVTTELQFSSVRHGEALFAYEVDLAALTDRDREAVRSALRGRLTGINEAAKTEQGPIRALQTGILRRRERRAAWRINLFGIVNVRSVSELLRKGTLSYDVATGTLNAADEIASRKILVRTRPLESDADKVRKLVFESMIVTAAYQASRVTSGVDLTCSASYFEARRKTTTADLRADYNAVIGMGLADAAERDRRLGAEHDFGRSTFLLECAFDQRASDALFIGPQGPYSRDYYDRIGRDALLALIPAGDTERAHRRAAIEQESTWTALKIAGPAAARFDLARKLGAVRAEHVISDYIVIRWWSEAMSQAAKALMEMRQFLAGRPAQSLAADPEFARRRGTLEKELAGVVKESKSQFGDPWGILALDGASGRTAAAQATIVGPRFTAIYNERVLPAARLAPALAAAPEVQEDPLITSRAPKRPFTADERELLRRHAINLRLGAFSADGEFQSDEADVQRLFTELLPAEIAARKASGQKMRLLFYAHGGLTDERSGLEPVLARLKFWRQNNIYPVSFVWETGLRETVSDILRGLMGTREMARGLGEDIADAVIEAAGRPGGKRVWGQMKRSAEVSVLEGGGAAFVAERTRELWNAHSADMEVHAAGHSAGTIFHAHFLPALLARATTGAAAPIRIKTLHLLAPACTTALFNTKLKGLVGPDKGIESVTMYTMNRNLERDDTAGPYRKSLLYLVSKAFENEQPTPILGLEESVRQDVGLIRFFGLAGNQKQADLLFSKTEPGASARARTEATRHGGFDDDAATMTSLVRRVLDVPDGTAVVDFFQEKIEETREPVSAADLIAAAVERPAAIVAPAIVPAPALRPPRVEPVVAGGGTRRALCVGIDKYGAPYDLAGCVNDATNWAKALRGLTFDVTMLTDQGATRAAILDAFGTLVRSARAGDVVVFQFAGHGTQVDDLDGDEDDARDEAFCPADFAEGRLLIDDDIKAAIAGVQAGVNLTCFIDCCHSGTITRALVPGGRPAVPPGSRARYIPYSSDISELHRAFRAGAEGQAGTATRSAAPAQLKEVCFSACQPFEVAYETAGAGQFTTRAIKVLSAGGGLTNLAFMEQVVAEFGPNAAQHPHLDCADDARVRTLLGPVGVGVAVPLG